MKLKALIVDDEYPARQELRYMLQDYKDIEVVGEATNAKEALNLVSALDYSVLFLDINMPGMNGLELSRAIQKKPNPPLIVFVTAYEEHALEAFEVNAVDYLLKPLDEKRLKQAIDRIRHIVEHRQHPTTAPSKDIVETDKGSFNRLPVESEGKTILLDQNDLIYACTQGDNVYIKTANGQYLTRFTLKELEARLNPKIFFRCHRAYIANLTKIREIVPFFNGTYTLIMADKQNSEVPVSRKQARILKNLLGIN